MHLTRARGGDDELAADLAAWGADPTEAAELLDAQRDQDFEVDPENWSAVVLFLRSQTQWRVSAMGARTGLDYAGVKLTAELSGVEITPELFAQVQTLEITTINELGRRAKNG